MVEKMTREGRTDPSERMLPFKDEIQLTRVLKRTADKAGINYGTKNEVSSLPFFLFSLKGVFNIFNL
jgi:hypothetical protein